MRGVADGQDPSLSMTLFAAADGMLEVPKVRAQQKIPVGRAGHDGLLARSASPGPAPYRTVRGTVGVSWLR